MEPNPVKGAQVVHRAAVLLRLVGQARHEGAEAGRLATMAGLTKPTAHRLLSSLAAEGLLEHDATDGRWYLGPEAYVMGTFAAARYPIETLAHPSLQRLAAVTGESAFLSMRRGNVAVCLLREEGGFPLRSFVLRVGDRLPLGIGSAGLAIVAQLPLTEREAALRDLDLSDHRWGERQTLPLIRSAIAAAQANGWVVNPGLLVEGSYGMGAAVFDRQGRPTWALSLTGVESRFRPERQRELGQLLLLEAHRVTNRIRELAPGTDGPERV